MLKALCKRRYMLGWIDNYVFEEGGEEGKDGAGTKIKNKERKSKGELTVLCHRRNRCNVLPNDATTLPRNTTRHADRQIRSRHKRN